MNEIANHGKNDIYTLYSIKGLYISFDFPEFFQFLMMDEDEERLTIKSIRNRICTMETQEYLITPGEIDREFAEADKAIAGSFPDWADIAETKRRVAYFLVSRIRTEKMPEIAQKAKVSTAKCYEFIKESDCRQAQEYASNWLLAVHKRKLLDEINELTCKIGRLAREKKLAAPQFSNDMRRVCRAAEPRFALGPIEFFYLGIKMTDRLSDSSTVPDRECLDKVKAQLKEIEQ